MGNLFSKKDELSKEIKHHSASYTEESSDVDKAELFVDDPQPPAKPAVLIRPSQQAVCKLIFYFDFIAWNLNFNFITGWPIVYFYQFNRGPILL